MSCASRRKETRARFFSRDSRARVRSLEFCRLTDELFGGLSVGAAVVDPDSVSIKLKDLKDHLSLVQTLNDRFANSKSNHVVRRPARTIGQNPIFVVFSLSLSRGGVWKEDDSRE